MRGFHDYEMDFTGGIDTLMCVEFALTRGVTNVYLQSHRKDGLGVLNLGVNVSINFLIATVQWLLYLPPVSFCFCFWRDKLPSGPGSPNSRGF